MEQEAIDLSIEIEQARVRAARYKRMAQHVASYLMEGLVAPVVVGLVARELFIRASGDCVCSLCGLTYYDHPQVPQHAGIHLICTGTWVKL